MAVRKCKGSSHVDVRAIKANGVADGKGVWTVNRLDHGSCKNDKTYNGTLYVLTRLGRPGMKLMPDLAESLPTRLREAAQMRECVQFKHKVLGVWVNVRRMKLTSDAALVLADTLDQATA